MARALTPKGCVLLALGVLLLPFRWLVAWGMVCAAHEWGHILAGILLGGKVRKFTADLWGAKLEIHELSPGRELLTALAGPGAGLLGLAFMPWLPEAGVCAVCQGIYNLLPIHPLDGGRVLHCLLRLMGGEDFAWRISRFCNRIFMILLWGAGVLVAFFRGWGMWPLLCLLLLHSKVKKGNIP